MLRFLLWRLLGLLALLVGFALVQWCLRGGPGRALRGSAPSGGLASLLAALGSGAARLCHAVLASGTAVGWSPRMLLAWALLVASVIGIARWRARRRRTYVRLRIHPYRTDRATAEAVVTMFATLHKRLLRRWWRRLLAGQPTVALEVHHACASPASRAWLAVCCPRGTEAMVEAALRAAYPNCRTEAIEQEMDVPRVVLRLKKSAGFIRRVKVVDHHQHEREPAVNRLLRSAHREQELVIYDFLSRLYKSKAARERNRRAE